MTMMKHIKSWLKNRKHLAILIIITLVVVLGGRKVLGQKLTAPQYQTAQAEKGTLIVSITGSGHQHYSTQHRQHRQPNKFSFRFFWRW